VADSLKALDLKRPIREADMPRRPGHFRTRALQHRADLFDHLVGTDEEGGRDSEAKDHQRFKIDDQSGN
jgi:hypothetical protein